GGCEGPAKLDTNTEGQKTFTVKTKDKAGNTDSKTVSYTVKDTTAPQIEVKVPVANKAYEMGADVASEFSCTDTGGTGVAEGGCEGPAKLDTSSEGQKTFTVTARDKAGNRSEKNVIYKVDGTDPTIDLKAPVEGKKYRINQDVKAEFSCADEQGGSGLDSCVGTVANGTAIDTATAGNKTFTVTAKDKAGNASEKNVTYKVNHPPKISLGSASPVDYSDRFSQSATATDADSPDGDLKFSASALPADLKLMSQSGPSTSIAGKVQEKAGAYSPKLTVTDELGDSASANATVDVNKEDAEVQYSGDTIAGTGTNLTLEATVRDSAAQGYEGPNSESGADATIGDITKMSVRFDVYQGTTCGSGTPLKSYTQQVA
ncbi:MAG: hypothetical protein LC708_03940, partial [Actinobacteria bacterium]|nr:hypothetical protein [Actinomycetota bacterium]